MKLSVARKCLPKRLQKLSDDQVMDLVNQLELIAEIFIETYEEKGSKKHLGVIDTQLERLDNEERN